MQGPFKHRHTFLLCALFVGATLALFFVPQSIKPSLFLGLAFVFAAFLIFLRRARLGKAAALVVLALLLALIPSYLYDKGDDVLSPYVEKNVAVTVTIYDVLYNGDTTFATGTVDDVDGKATSVKVRITIALKDVKSGDVISARAYIQAIDLKDEDENAVYNLARDYRYSLTLYSAKHLGERQTPAVFAAKIRASLTDRIGRYVPGEAGGLLSALLLGERDGLSDAFKADMARLGTSHMLALSGLHLSVLILGVERLLMKIGIGRRTRYGAVALLTVFFLFLTGFPVSAIRAGVMLLFSFASFFFMQEYDGITSLGLATAVICAIQPYSVLDGSLWLSVLATFGILLSLEREDKSTLSLPSNTFPARASRYLLSSVKITLSASVATLPLTAYMFGTFPLLFIFANLLFAPLMQILITAALLVLLFGWIPVVSSCASFLARTMIEGAASLSSLRGIQLSLRHPVTIAFLLVAVLLLFLYVGLCSKEGYRKRTPIVIIVAFSLCLSCFHGMSSFLNARTLTLEYATTSSQNGDFFILRFGTRTTVIDCTRAAKTHIENVFDTLSTLYECEADDYVFTSYQSALSDSSDTLLSSYAIGRVYLPSPQSTDEEKVAEAITVLCEKRKVKLFFYEVGTPLSVGDLSITLHHREPLGAATKRTYFSVCYGKHRFAYLSSGMLTNRNYSIIKNELVGCSAVFFGVYGTKNTGTFPALEAFTSAYVYAANADAVPFSHIGGLRTADSHSIKWKSK